ncbi:MAG TPA: hypothetical protein VE344_04335 [Methylomirabilota bacterium]|nr:hypothetical protein [Methylomirabilota bacterium]
MSETADFTAAGAEWQDYCRDWAKTSQPFRIHDIKEEHLLFCEQLCLLHKYKYWLTGSTANFIPDNSY